ncbi:cupin domain-containing protein [Vibrio sp. ZSDE26]|uniref:Cupin domain-containing protein n=1 Tax=Vibrio amylolyticus TaxID=2847292 RepID=A0A9X2BIL2_9VIBR|nr:cupin domain-containing protein [Vibrio amylolyticus]MCK6264260.1 cupin domain-containing protein [Vibrio amylolyticus]
MSNIYSNIPNTLPQEIFTDLLKTEHLRVERIVSDGHSSPESGWYDQNENEWVIVLQGQGVLEFEDGRIITLNVGDHHNIKAGEKHKVLSTSANEKTIWLALFYSK